MTEIVKTQMDQLLKKDDKDEILDKIYDEYETNLTFIGASAIED